MAFVLTVTVVLLSMASSSRGLVMDRPSPPGTATQSATTAPATSGGADNDKQLTSKDGVMTLRLPAEWTQTKSDNPEIVIEAEASRSRGIYVFSNLKADFVSVETYAKATHDNDLSALKNPQSTDATIFTIGGRPAVRYDTTFDDGVYKWGQIEVFTETATRFNTVVINGLRSDFDAQKEQWASFAAGLNEMPGANDK